MSRAKARPVCHRCPNSNDTVRRRVSSPTHETAERNKELNLPDNKKHYEQSQEWMTNTLMMEELCLNSPDDKVQLLAALTATGEVYDHPEYACAWTFLIHFGFMDADGNVLPQWKRYWRNTGRKAWEEGGRDRWLTASDGAFPRDIGPQL
jgi:hypothetical protein